jgi:hypothetical protein
MTNLLLKLFLQNLHLLLLFLQLLAQLQQCSTIVPRHDLPDFQLVEHITSAIALSFRASVTFKPFISLYACPSSLSFSAHETSNFNNIKYN